MRPADRGQFAIGLEIRLVEALTAQAIDRMARLIRQPFLIDLFIEARQHAQHIIAPRIDANVRADRIHHIDGFSLLQFPRPRIKRIGLRGQRTDGAEINHIGRKLARQGLFEIGGDFHIFAAANGPKLGHASHFGRKTDAACALDAARHHRFDQRAHILFFNRALIFVIARTSAAKGHRLVLQVAFPALVANRAIQRMIDQ